MHVFVGHVLFVCFLFLVLKLSVLTSFTFLLQQIQLGRSKWNGNVGSSGIVLRVETPLCNVGNPAFSIQVNSGIEF